MVSQLKHCLTIKQVRLLMCIPGNGGLGYL